MGKHSAERRSGMPFILATVAVVGLAVAAFLVVRLVNGSVGSTASAASPLSISTSSTSSGSSTTSSATSATTSTTTTSAPPTSTAPTTSAADTAARAALQACVDRQAAAKGVLETIAVGAAHWRDHVQGQTDIDSGARSLIDVKTATWGPTRAAGPADVAAFQAAQGAYAGAPACPTTVAQLPAPPDVAGELQACGVREQAMDGVVGTGTQVMADWGTHLSEMADHADGHINSAAAQANWLKRWAEAPAHLAPYKTAVDALAAAPVCAA